MFIYFILLLEKVNVIHVEHHAYALMHWGKCKESFFTEVGKDKKYAKNSHEFRSSKKWMHMYMQRVWWHLQLAVHFGHIVKLSTKELCMSMFCGIIYTDSLHLSQSMIEEHCASLHIPQCYYQVVLEADLQQGCKEWQTWPVYHHRLN